MKAIIVSDLHLGSQHSRCDQFMRFVGSLPEGVALVLNGDTVNTHDTRRYPKRHLEVLEMLREESLKRRVIWVVGNHDERYVMENPGKIEFVPSYNFEKRLYVAHGYDFDNVMPRNRFFILLFRFIHRVRIALGAESVHVAYYAKRFPFLYHILLRHVTLNAVEFAKENGYAAVVCGHTHFVEDKVQDGVRYINTGTWTEPQAYYLAVDDSSMELRPVIAEENIEHPTSNIER